jgi:hypothetical protein
MNHEDHPWTQKRGPDTYGRSGKLGEGKNVQQKSIKSESRKVSFLGPSEVMSDEDDEEVKQMLEEGLEVESEKSKVQVESEEESSDSEKEEEEKDEDSDESDEEFGSPTEGPMDLEMITKTRFTNLERTTGEELVLTHGSTPATEIINIDGSEDNGKGKAIIRMNGKPIWESDTFRNNAEAFWVVTGKNLYSALSKITLPFDVDIVDTTPVLPGVGCLTDKGPMREMMIKAYEAMGIRWCLDKAGVEVRGRGAVFNSPSHEPDFLEALTLDFPMDTWSAEGGENPNWTNILDVFKVKDMTGMMRKWFYVFLGCVGESQWSRAFSVLRQWIASTKSQNTSTLILKTMLILSEPRFKSGMFKGFLDWKNELQTSDAATWGAWISDIREIPLELRTKPKYLSWILAQNQKMEASKEIMSLTKWNKVWARFRTAFGEEEEGLSVTDVDTTV